MKRNEQMLAALDAALQEAIRAKDVTAESVARVNIACAYLQLESPQALPAFDAAMAATRRAQNPRSEAILSMAFAPYFLESGDPARALELARRGEEVMRRGRRGHRVLSLIQLARVLYAGFSDAEQAGKKVDLALSVLAEGDIAEPVDREVVVRSAGQAAQAAVQAGDVERAIALARIVDPATAERLEQMRPEPAAGLSAAQRKQLGFLYGKWRSRFESRKADPRTAEMTRKAREMLRWDDARGHRNEASGNVDAVCVFVERVQAVATGSLPMAAASAAAPGPLTDDDLVFTVVLAADRDFNTWMPASVVFELVARGARDPALAGRCFRLAAAMGGQERDPRERLALLKRAEAALAGGVDDQLRAEVANETAVCLLNRGQGEAALHAAERAAELARKCGDDRLGRMARGNVANALLGLERVPEALEMFEALARDQAAAGERDMAEITRQNIEACRVLLRRRPRGG